MLLALGSECLRKNTRKHRPGCKREGSGKRACARVVDAATGQKKFEILAVKCLRDSKFHNCPVSSVGRVLVL